MQPICPACQGAYPLLPGDVVAFKTSPAFVDHVWELFAPFLAPLLALGSTPATATNAAATAAALVPAAAAVNLLVVQGDDAVLAPRKFVGLLARHSVTHLVRGVGAQGWGPHHRPGCLGSHRPACLGSQRPG